MKISIGILAGGRSRRMGENKAFLSLGETSFLDRALEEFGQSGQLILSVDRKEKYRGLDLDLVEDQLTGLGPLEGIRQVLKNSQEDWAFILAVDMPFLDRRVIDYLGLFLEEGLEAVIITEAGRPHPLCGFYRKGALEVIEAKIQEGNYKIFDSLRDLRTKYVPIELSCLSPRILRNINTRQDYESLVDPPIISYCGEKDTGKTTYISSLLRLLKARGFRVGVLKHDGHRFNMDHQGTDTYEFSQAGASQIGIFSRDQYAYLSLGTRPDLGDILEDFRDLDLVIIEGLKGLDFKKFELVRAKNYKGLTSNPKNRLGIVSDDPKRDFGGEAVFDFHRPETMVDFLEARLIRNKKKRP